MVPERWARTPVSRLARAFSALLQPLNHTGGAVATFRGFHLIYGSPKNILVRNLSWYTLEGQSSGPGMRTSAERYGPFCLLLLLHPKRPCQVNQSTSSGAEKGTNR